MPPFLLWFILFKICYDADHLTLALDATNQRPLHSTFSNNNNSYSWICDSGYFKSTPTSLTGTPTCRACTPIIGAGCRVGWQLNPCTSTSDAVCRPCVDAPPVGHVYFRGGNCQDTVCAAGWALSGELCIPCPQGFYCNGGSGGGNNNGEFRGLAIPCGVNCTTPYQGAVSSLECIQVQGNQNDEMAFVMQSTFSILLIKQQPFSSSSSISDNNNNHIIITINNNQDDDNISATTIATSALVGSETLLTCPQFNAFITSWLTYGTLQSSCSLLFLSQALGTLSCTISAAQCIAGSYLSWLLNAATINQDTTASILADCLFSPHQIAISASSVYYSLMLGSPLIQQKGSLLSLLHLFSQQQVSKKNAGSSSSASNNMIDTPPVLNIAPRTWGQGHGQTLMTLLVICIVMVCLVLTTMCAFSIFYVKYFKHNSTMQTILDHLFKMRKKTFKKLLPLNNNIDLENNNNNGKHSINDNIEYKLG